MKYIGLILITIALAIQLVTLVHPLIYNLKIKKTTRQINLTLLLSIVLFVIGIILFVIEG